MAPHSQVCDVDSVEDYVFYAASEIMPISEVLLRSAHQTPNVHLRAGQGVRFPGCQYKLVPLSLLLLARLSQAPSLALYKT